MNFTVDWEPAARIELADIWNTAPDRAADTRASAELDRLLSADPHAHGRHLSEGLWLIFVPPLAAFYTIDMTRRQVEVNDLARTA